LVWNGKMKHHGAVMERKGCPRAPGQLGVCEAKRGRAGAVAANHLWFIPRRCGCVRRPSRRRPGEDGAKRPWLAPFCFLLQPHFLRGGDRRGASCSGAGCAISCSGAGGGASCSESFRSAR